MLGSLHACLTLYLFEQQQKLTGNPRPRISCGCCPCADQQEELTPSSGAIEVSFRWRHDLCPLRILVRTPFPLLNMTKALKNAKYFYLPWQNLWILACCPFKGSYSVVVVGYLYFVSSPMLIRFCVWSFFCIFCALYLYFSHARSGFPLCVPMWDDSILCHIPVSARGKDKKRTAARRSVTSFWC